MKKITADDYTNLGLSERKKVDEWVDKYNLEHVHTVVHSEPNNGIVCLGYNVFKIFKKDHDFVLSRDPDENPIVIAIFDFDDFPWEAFESVNAEEGVE